MKLKSNTTAHWLACLVIAGAVCSNPAFSQDAGKPAKTTADREAIIEQIAVFTTAVNNRDSYIIANLYTEDGDVIFHDGPKLSGRETIRKSVKAEFSNLSPTCRIKIIVTDIRFLRPNLAIVDTEATHSEGELRKDRGTHVMVRDRKKWLTTSLRVYPARKLVEK